MIMRLFSGLEVQIDKDQAEKIKQALTSDRKGYIELGSELYALSAIESIIKSRELPHPTLALPEMGNGENYRRGRQELERIKKELIAKKVISENDRQEEAEQKISEEEIG